jgi:RNA polymerase sigma-70 factor (ECF subfamily)
LLLLAEEGVFAPEFTVRAFGSEKHIFLEAQKKSPRGEITRCRMKILGNGGCRMSLSVLMEEVKRGSEEAFEALYRAGYKELRAFFLRRGFGNEADDMVQQTMVAVWNSAGKYDPLRDAKAWIYGIARNIAYKEWRKQRWRVDFCTPHPNLGAIPVAGITPERQQVNELLQRALDRLPDSFRECILLIDMQGFDFEIAAQVLESSIENLKRTYSRARNRLRELLKEDLVNSSQSPTITYPTSSQCKNILLSELVEEMAWYDTTKSQRLQATSSCKGDLK